MAQQLSSRANSSLEVTRDAFLGGRVMLAQPVSGHRAGVDAVLLAASVMGEDRAQRILDVGAGPGTVGILLAHRLENALVTSVEIEEQLVALAQHNRIDNGFSDRVEIIQADICLPFLKLKALGLRPNHFDQVVSNPPFYNEDAARVSGNGLKRRAHSMAPGSLEKWLKFMTTVTRADGLMSLIYPAERLDDLLELLSGRFGALDIFPIFPHEGQAAIRVIIRGRKGSRAPLKLHSGLVLHGEDDAFTPAAREILNDAAPLVIGGS